MTDNAHMVTEFMEDVWNRGDVDAVDRYVAEHYTIRSDPGDPWDGATLSRAAFRQRLATSRAPFPDLRFELTDVVAHGDSVAIGWVMRGTHTGALGSLPATGRRIDVRGMTIYYLHEGRLTGHRQVVDRLSVAHQLGLAGGPDVAPPQDPAA